MTIDGKANQANLVLDGVNPCRDSRTPAIFPDSVVRLLMKAFSAGPERIFFFSFTLLTPTAPGLGKPIVKVSPSCENFPTHFMTHIRTRNKTLEPHSSRWWGEEPKVLL